MELILRAIEFASERHNGHVRKYTGEPYFVHLAEVATLVATVTNDPETIAAAYLHDAIEDVNVTPEEIERATTPRVSELVWWLTDCPLSFGNRAKRKATDNDRLWRSPPDAQTIKYADSISNTRSITRHDPKWAPTYLAEKRELLARLDRGHPTLYRMALRLSDSTNQ